jgi:hypothetical protein
VTAAAISETTPFFTWLGDAYTQLAVAQVSAIEHFNGFLSFCLVAHFYKREAFRPAAISILDQRY